MSAKSVVLFLTFIPFVLQIDSEAGPGAAVNGAPKAAVFGESCFHSACSLCVFCSLIAFMRHTDYANAARKASQPAYSSPPLETTPAPVPAAAPAEAAKGSKTGKKNAEKKAAAEGAVVAPEVHAAVEPAPVVAAPVVAAPVPEVAVVAPSPAHAAAPKQRLPSPEPAVESIMFGSVVAPVVNPADRSVLHFGSQAASALAEHRTEKAPAAACPPSSSTAAHAGEKSAASAPAAAPAAPSTVAAAPSNPPHVAPHAVEEAAKPAAWGAKKSFADVSAVGFLF
jgi:hypothetical protein